MNVIKARYPAQDISPDPANPPTDIQWMPPGQHTIRALQNGTEPVTLSLSVTKAVADKLAAQLAAKRSLALQGQEDLPYLDFNHDDGPAAARVLNLYWGGDDPVKGGIRAVVEWTDAGRLALAGKSFRRFSPEFSLDKKSGEIGIGTNLGGLVNNAAFKTIAPIIARAADAQVGQFAIADLNAHPFMKEVQAWEGKGLSHDAAMIKVMQSEPQLYSDYVAMLQQITADATTAQAGAAVEMTQGQYARWRAGAVGTSAPSHDEIYNSDPFILQARGMARPVSEDFVQAAERLARENPSGYSEYRARCGLAVQPGSAPATTAPVSMEAVEAMEILARDNPEAYENYRARLGLGSTHERTRVSASGFRFESGQHHPFLQKTAELQSQGLPRVDAMRKAAELFPAIYQDYQAQALT